MSASSVLPSNMGWKGTCSTMARMVPACAAPAAMSGISRGQRLFVLGTTGPVAVPDAFVSGTRRLEANRPNPFGETGATRIGFDVPAGRGLVSLRVFDVQGRLVRTLVNGPVEAGTHTVTWNGRNDQEREVSAGVNFYSLEAGEESATRKMILLRYSL